MRAYELVAPFRAPRRPARLRRPGAGRIDWVETVDIKRDVGRPVTDHFARLCDHVLDADPVDILDMQRRSYHVAQSLLDRRMG